MRRLLPVLFLFAISGAARGGIGIIGGGGVCLRPTQAGNALAVRLQIKRAHWTARSGHGPVVPSPALLVAPAGGEWTDLTLDLTGTLEIRTPEGRIILDAEGHSLTIPLETPASGGERLTLDLALPDWLSETIADGNAGIGIDPPGVSPFE